MFYIRTLALGLGLFCFGLSGCDKPKEVEKPNNGTDAHAHDHDDAHDHSHDDDTAEGKLGPMGPNGGHQIDFGNDPINAEWIHYNDNDMIRIVVLDEAGKANRRIKADSVSIRRTAKADGPWFTLVAEEADENGAAEKYMLDDKNLAIAMVLGVTVEIKMDGKTFAGKIPPHEPHSH